MSQRVPLGHCFSVVQVCSGVHIQSSFALHWRDPGKVAMNGGLYQVAPVGVFQPSHDAQWNVPNDFDLWRSIQREMHEELLGGSEEYGSDTAPIDYRSWRLWLDRCWSFGSRGPTGGQGYGKHKGGKLCESGLHTSLSKLGDSGD